MESIEIDCRQVLVELVDYMEDDLAPELRRRMELHLSACRHCAAIYDGVHNLVLLLGDQRLIELPAGFSQRLLTRLSQHSQIELRQD